LHGKTGRQGDRGIGFEVAGHRSHHSP
jgi:hypothetical protein